MIKLSEKSEDGTDMLSADVGNIKMPQVTRGSPQLFLVNAGTVS